MILERDREMTVLAAAAEAARGGSGSFVLVEGPAGAGKSALLSQVPTDGMHVARAAAGEWERDFAFGALRQLLAGFPDALLVGATAAIVASPPPEALEPGFALLDAVHWTVAALAGRSPVLLAIDDLHWVDDASLQALGYLSRRVADLPVLIVATMRPAEPGAPGERLDGLRASANVLSPAPLSGEAVAILVRAERAEADDAQVAAYHEASGGNPLYLRELLRAEIDGDVRVTGLPTLGDRIVRRVARLAPEAPTLAGTIALLGDGHPLALAAQLAELEPATAQRVAHELTRIGILAADDPPAFVHPVIRHSVYTVLTSARRASLHAGAAEALDGAGAPIDAVAAHLTALPPAGSEAVAARLRDAALDALGRGATGTAVARLRRALEEGARPSADLLFELGRAESLMGDPAALAHLEQALIDAEGPLRLRVRLVLAELHAYAGSWDRSAAVIDGGADEPDPELELVALRAVLEANDPDRVEHFIGAWDDLARASLEQRRASPAIAALLASEAVSRGRATEVPGHVRTALRRGGVPGGVDGWTWPITQLMMALVQSDALEQADALGQAMAETGRRTGTSVNLLIGLMAPTWTAARRGLLAEAEARVERILDVVGEAGMSMWTTSVAWMVDDVILERSALATFRRQLLVLELPPEFDRTTSGATLRAVRARFHLDDGNMGAAADELRTAEPALRAVGVGPARLPWRSLLALADDDVSLAAEDLALARETGYPRPIGIALRALGVLLENTTLLRESLEVLEAAPSMLERAYTRVELGAMLLAQGHRGEAREMLSSAADLAFRCGAERLLARARDELTAAGARPRREALAGIDALTPRELHVAQRAAHGLTNVLIAQELFVSLKTVETHLTNAYAKLGLRGRGARGQLTAALRPRGAS